MTLKLISARIKNFKSLGDVDLNFRDLTILVGANASGKSNSLEALGFLNRLLMNQTLPPVEYMDRILRVGQKDLFYQINIEDDENNKAEYNIVVTVSKNNTCIDKEYLLVNGIEVINIINGEGIVKDENDKNYQPYQSSEGDGLALTDAGKYGHKPFTKKLASYIKDWKFYDVDPDSIRTYSRIPKRNILYTSVQNDEIIPNLNPNASKAQTILQYWAIHERNKFDELSQELYDCLNIRLH
ncbi:AAA family ATPase, partial [Dolichospermum sp. ST_sed9]|nr:AAA family ATPase [Dolichospermum sp. ST_sed9]